jgi:hypothetical protein
MAGYDKRDDQPQATKTKLDTIVSHLDAMKTLITSLQKEINAGDFSGRVRRACIHGGNDSFAKLPFTIPPYNGKYDPAAYLDWELAVEQKFSCHDLPASSQVTTAISAFTDLALHWWRYEQKIPISTPTTWAELKAAMRRRFVPSYYARNIECDVQERRSKQYSNSFAGQARHPAQHLLSSCHPHSPLQRSRAQRHPRPPLHRSRGRPPHLQFQNHHFPMTLLRLLQKQVLLMMLRSWMVRIVLMS